jgi:LysM repeat protein
LGRHSKPSRIRLPQGATAAAAPTIAGVAAAFCLAPQASAADVPAAFTPRTPTLDAEQLNLSSTLPTDGALLTAKRQAAPAVARPAVPATYRVRAGDSLSSIAAHLYGNRKAWPVIYWHNHTRIKWANDIYAGEVLRIPAKPGHIPDPPAQLAPKPVVVTPAPSSAGGSAPEPAQSSGTATDASYSGTYPGGAFGQCVVAHESGGNPQIMNSTGHYGLYQFSASTWAAYGGNPADFGHASVAEQNQVFANALAAGGQDNWAPYDGC